MKKKLLLLFFILAYSFAQGQTAVLTCNTCGFQFYVCNFSIDSVLREEAICNNLGPKIIIAVLDPCSFTSWTTDTCIYPYNGSLIYGCGPLGSNCINHPSQLNYFQFDVYDTAQMIALANFIPAIPNSYHILAFTYNSAPYSTVPNWPSVQSALMALGSSMISTIPDNIPFILYIKKGFPSTLHEIAATSSQDTISLTVTIECVPASVNENESNVSLSFFPNPATNEFRIKNSELRIENIEIFSTLGEKVINQQPMVNSQQREIKIDVATLIPGIYFVKLWTEKGIITKKFIKG